MVKDSGYKLYAVNITADGTVPLGGQSAFWMPCLKDGRITAMEVHFSNNIPFS